MKKAYLTMLLLALALLGQGALADHFPVEVKYYYVPGCPVCDQVNKQLGSLEAQYGERISVEGINANEKYYEFIDFQKEYGIDIALQSKVPKVFTPDDYCIGPECYSKLDAMVESAMVCEPDQNSDIPICPPGEGAGQQISIVELAVLGFIDAINPCEIAVLVILLTSIMTRFPKQRRKALNAGLAFSGAVLIMYFIFGLLLIMGIQAVSGVSGGLNNWIVGLTGFTFYQLLGMFAVLIGLLNIKDAIWYKGGGFVMEVPESWRPRMKQILYSVGAKKPEPKKGGGKDCPGCDVMETGTVTGLLKSKSYLIGAFLAGLVVSFFLTPCTAQAYVIAAGILSEFPLMVMLPYLLFYLAIFIAPMVIITLIIYAGFVAVEDVSGWRERNIKNLHWAVGLMLIALGVAIVMGLMRMPI